MPGPPRPPSPAGAGPGAPRQGDRVGLGANGIQSPAIPLRPNLGGLVGPGAARGLRLVGRDVARRGGSLDGGHRARPAALGHVETRWSHGLRLGAGKLRRTRPW